jgi:ribonuclease HI
MSRGSAGWVIKSYNNDSKVVLEGRSEITDLSTTVASECKAIIYALEDVLSMGGRCVRVRTDLMQIVSQISEDEEKDDIEDVRNMLDKFEAWSIEYVSRDELTRPHDLAVSALENEE